MGRGNVCVTGRYEGLFYIDNDDINVYRRDDPDGDGPEHRLLRDLDYSELTGGGWCFDEHESRYEEEDILECFMDSFGRMFPSFSRVQGDVWIRTGAYGDYDRRVIMENSLFYIAVQDNQWSVAVELIQKEDPYCGADLKAGGGDVLLVKANGDWWTVNGFLKGDVSK